LARGIKKGAKHKLLQFDLTDVSLLLAKRFIKGVTFVAPGGIASLFAFKFGLYTQGPGAWQQHNDVWLDVEGPLEPAEISKLIRMGTESLEEASDTPPARTSDVILDALPLSAHENGVEFGDRAREGIGLVVPERANFRKQIEYERSLCAIVALQAVPVIAEECELNVYLR
jgi:hypothetical protein